MLRDLPKMEGKEVAVVGRYSFRAEGRWMSEQACYAPSDGAAATPAELWLVEGAHEAPKPEIELLAVVRMRAGVLDPAGAGAVPGREQ